MTLQDAESQFATIILKITPGLSADELLDIQTELVALAAAVPTSAEFNSIRDAVVELQPALVGGVTQAVLAGLESRTTILNCVTSLLSNTADEANARARGLTLAQPKAIADALKNAATSVREIQSAAKSGNFVQALEKARALQGLLSQAQSAIGS